MDRILLLKTLQRFLAEDVGLADVTGRAIFSEHETGSVRFIAGGEYIAAGIETVVAEVFKLANSSIITIDPLKDGSKTDDGMTLFTVSGPVVDILKAEQVARNLFRRMAGIATLTASLVDRVKVYKVGIADGRDATPGLRMFERYAHRVGGGVNGRSSLSDGILITQKHIAACSSVREAVERVKKSAPINHRIMVRANSLERVEECLRCGVDMIQFEQGMSVADMARAVQIANKDVITEVPLGDDPERLEMLAMTGVDFISVGDMTGFIPACPVNIDWSF